MTDQHSVTENSSTKKLNATFLTEGGFGQGFGHLTRCLALAQAFLQVESNIHIDFILFGDDHALQFLKAMQMPVRFLDWHQDIKTILTQISSSQIVIVDSYRASQEIYEIIANACHGKLLMIDDDNRLAYPPGIVLSPSVYGRFLPYDRRREIEYWTGPDYILLRNTFWKTLKKPLSEKVNKILLTLGGSQSACDFLDHLTSWFPIEFQNQLKIIDPRQEKWDAYEMHSFMLDADICITGGGITTEELARVGVPAIGIAFADGQRSNLEALEEAGCLYYIGQHHSPDLQKDLQEKLHQLQPLDKRARLSQAGQQLIDGQGALRVATALFSDKN